MKKILSIILILCCCMGLFAGCGTEQPSPTETATPSTENATETQETTAMPTESKTCNVLFIGNSYTFYNDMPTAYFQVMAKACGYDVQVTAITKGAYTLEKFTDPNDGFGARVARTLTPGAFDYVILQEQSVRPAVDTVPAFYDAVRKLAGMIRQSGAQPILYSTWGRETGSDTLEKYSMTNESMTWKLAAAYDAIGKELDIPVMHAGLAFYDVYTNSDINLYNADHSHPSAEGSYLAAMTLFCGIFGVDPTEAAFSGPVDAEEDAILRAAAKKVLQNTPQIPQEYQTASENVTNG